MNDNVDALSRTLLLCHDYVDPLVSDIGIVEAFRQFTISVAADTANLKSASGQSALISFVSLVSEWGFKSGLKFRNCLSLVISPLLTAYACGRGSKTCAPT